MSEVTKENALEKLNEISISTYNKKFDKLNKEEHLVVVKELQKLL